MKRPVVVLRVAALLGVASLVSFGCGPGGGVFSPGGPSPSQRAALRSEAASPDASPETLARAGWAELLGAGRTATAVRAFRRAREAGDQRWTTRFGLAASEDLRLDRAAALRAWGALLEEAPPFTRRLANLRIAAILDAGGLTTAERTAAREVCAAAVGRGHAALVSQLRDHACDPGGPAAGAFVAWSEPQQVSRLAALAFLRSDPLPPVASDRGARTVGSAGRLYVGDRAGFYVVDAVVEAEAAGPHLLVLETEGAARVSLDGAVVLERDAVFGYPPRFVSAALELGVGGHDLRVELGVRRPGASLRAWLVPVSDLSSSPAFEDEAAPLTVALWAEAWALTELGDPAAALAPLERALRRAPESAGLRWLEARHTASAPFLPYRRRMARETELLQTAVGLDPTLATAHARLGRVMLDEGRDEEAMEHARQGRAAAPVSIQWDLLEHDVYGERGWEPESRTALQRALSRAPDDCGLRKQAIDLEWESLRGRGWAPDPALARRCPAVARAQASYLLQSGRPAQAAELWLAVGGSSGGSEADRRAAARALLAAGRADEAVEILAALVAADPGELELGLALSDALLQAGRPAEAARQRAAVAARPEGTADVRQRLRHAHGEPFWAPFEIDGAAWVEEQREQARSLDPSADAVILLDQQVSRFYGDGRAEHYAHGVILLRTPRGAETFGELVVPEGAELVFARTLRADGRAVEPEEMAEKDTLSMPSLEPGAAIDFAYVRPQAARDMVAPDILTDPFYLQSYQAPILRSEWTMVTPEGIVPAAAARGDLAAPVGRRWDGLVARTWSKTGVEQMRGEGAVPDVRTTLPSVAVATVDWDELARRLADRALPLLRIGPRLAGWMGELGPALAEGDAPATLMTAVQREIEEVEDGELDVPAEHAAHLGEGERAVVFTALLRALGYDAALMLVKPVFRSWDGEDVPDPLSFSYPVVRIRDDRGRERWFDPSLRWAPPDYLPPILQGQPAIALSAGAVGERATAPAYPPQRELRHARLELELSADGARLSGRGREELRGINAVSMRTLLTDAEAAQRRTMVTALVRASVPDAELTCLAFEGLETPSVPLVITYELVAPVAPPRIPGPPQRLALGLLPENYSANWIRTGTRRQPLFFNVTVHQKVELSLRLPPGAQLARLPKGASVDGAYGTSRVTVASRRGDDGRSVVLARKESHVPLAIVPAARFAVFSWVCRSLDRADQLPLDIAWRK